MNDLLVEVRAAEGGDDAKALVCLQVSIYLKLASRRSL
jgi:protein subunit release factor A